MGIHIQMADNRIFCQTFLQIREGEVEKFKDAVAEAIQPVRDNDPGCHYYNVSITDSGLAVFSESHENFASVEHHWSICKEMKRTGLDHSDIVRIDIHCLPEDVDKLKPNVDVWPGEKNWFIRHPEISKN